MQSLNCTFGQQTATMENDDHFKTMIELLRDILVEVRKGKSNHVKPFDLADLIDGVHVKQILDIGKSTLYRLKQSKIVDTVRLGKRDYYSRIEIEKIIDHYKK